MVGAWALYQKLWQIARVLSIMDVGHGQGRDISIQSHYRGAAKYTRSLCCWVA